MPTPNNRRNASRARCQFEACDKFAQTRGLCKAHGGGSRCRDPLCNKLAQSRGLCIAHGGGRRCQFDGCKKLAQSKGHCISHGGGRRCAILNCEKFSQVKGRCKSHSKLHSVVTPTSPTCAKLSIDFLLSRNTSMGAKAPHRQQVQTPAVRPATYLAVPLLSAGMGCNPQYDTQMLGNQHSLLSFLAPHGTTNSSCSALQPQFPAMSDHYRAPTLPSLTMYR